MEPESAQERARRLFLRLAREMPGWKQWQMAERIGVAPPHLGSYERGRRRLLGDRLHRLLAKLGLLPEVIDLTLFGVELLAPVEPIEPVGGTASLRPLDPGPEERRGFDLALAQVAWGTVAGGRAEMVHEWRQRRLAAARAEAERLWEKLQPWARRPRERQALVEGVEEFWHWAFALKLCDLAEQRAAHSAQESLALAELARAVAVRVPGAASWRARLTGWARSFVANALRVLGKLNEAEAEFTAAGERWAAGAEASDPELMDEGGFSISRRRSAERSAGLPKPMSSTTELWR